MRAVNLKSNWAILLALTIGAQLPIGKAHALPVFARQTGQECIACHISFPELTPYGRYFKLTGYTIGQRQWVPLAMMAQEGITSISNNNSTDNTGAPNGSVINRDNNPLFAGYSIFLAGKATDFLGAFIQYTYNNVSNAQSPAAQLKGATATDNTDIRAVYKYYEPSELELNYIFGFTLNNNPTVQDVWNSTPAFGFPFTTSPVAPTPGAATLIDGGLAQQVAGYGVYAYLKKTLYVEFSLYQTADGMLSWMRHGQDPSSEARLQGVNPYYRVALTHDWGPHSAMIGAYGINARVYADNNNPSAGTNRFVDNAFDAQYQYITNPHVVTSQFTFIYETQHQDANFASGAASNPTDVLKTWKAKLTYYYQRKYGATFQYFDTAGTIDPLLYPPGSDPSFSSSINGFLNGSPNSRGQIYELDFVPIQNLRLMLQYTAYNKFNGGSNNYDGFGRNASFNNTMFLNIWFAY
ncbi:MAG TPA: cytochrome C [Burkholderiales bacterium]|nr:cytochrome C [Burkholderiales bacterium]